jgi:hypothetical protein
MIAAVAITADRLRSSGVGSGRVPRLLAAGLVALVVAAGVGELLPQAMYPIEAVTPGPELLTEDAYFVNSGFYHPEAAAWRYPGKRFVGLPLSPGELDLFLRSFPGYRAVLWHTGGVQDGARYLVEARVCVVRKAINTAGLGYAVLMPRPAECSGAGRCPSRPVSSLGIAAGAGYPAAVFLCALALRGISLVLFLRTPYALYPVLDARRFYEWALGILAGEPAPGPFLYEPLYAYLQVAIYALTGIDFHHVLVFQAVAGSLGAVLAYFILLDHLPPRWSLAGPWPAAPIRSRCSRTPSRSRSRSPRSCLLATLLLLQRHVRSGDRRLFLAGLVFGLVLLVRENLLALLPVFLSLPARGRRRRSRLRRSGVPRWASRWQCFP